MSNEIKKPNAKKYDLEERTAKFGEAVIDFMKSLERNSINNPLINQLIRSATSVGANYVEADGAESKKDFKHKISICKKEAKETKHWLRMTSRANTDRKETCQMLWKEVQEFTLIFSAIINNTK